MLDKAKEIHQELIDWRRHIHMHPELGFEETETAKLVTEKLEEMGIEAQTGVGKTGVVGYLGEGSPVIGIRADMDALPIQEENDVPYKSQTPGLMHACGHDAHTAMLLGAAKLLSEMPERPAGQIRFFFQPSEERSDDENKSGAIRMIEDGALEETDAVIALHVISEQPANTIRIKGGPTTAAADSFKITIYGTGGHGAYPHMGTDPVHMLAQAINAINGIRARRIDPTGAAAVSIGSVHGGAVSNVIPSEIELTGTMRSYDPEIREQLKDEVRTAMGVVTALGGRFEVEFTSGYPATHNDHAVADMIAETASSMLGDEALLEPVSGMGAEDFSYMTQKAPGAMFWLGAKLDENNRPHHTPVFDISEDCLPTGAAMLADVAQQLLTKHG